MFSLNTKLRTGLDHRRNRQHPCKKALFVIRDHGKLRQFLAACCEKNIPLCSGQEFCCFFRALHINSFTAFVSLRTKNSLISYPCIFTGFPDIFCYFCCIRMSGIQNDLRSHLMEKLFHIFCFQPSGTDMKELIFLKEGAAILRSCTGINRNSVLCKKIADRVAFCCAGKNNGFIHSYIPLVLPSCHRYSLSGNFPQRQW